MSGGIALILLGCAAIIGGVSVLAPARLSNGHRSPQKGQRLSQSLAPSSSDGHSEVLLALAQHQCGHCGYDGCQPYADAIALGDTSNRCAPGGKTTMASLSRLLQSWQTTPHSDHPTRNEFDLVSIDVDGCIGCTKCIQVCPTDAIIGANGMQHRVIDEHCIGCGMCIDACPVDCIDLLPQTTFPSVPAAETSQHNYCIQCGDCDDICPVHLPVSRLIESGRAGAGGAEIAADCITCNKCTQVCDQEIDAMGEVRALIEQDRSPRHAWGAERAARREQRFSTLERIDTSHDQQQPSTMPMSALERARQSNTQRSL